MRKHYNIRVTGLVQGVWYRKNTKEQADKMGVTGFVRNEADGSVYIEAEATPDVLESFIRWCKEGPEEANVEGLWLQASVITGFREFVIEY